MATYTSKFAQRFRKALRATHVGFASADTADADVPTLTSGSGAPTAAEPNGSLYTDTAGTDGDDTLYARIGGAWVAIQGQTA